MAEETTAAPPAEKPRRHREKGEFKILEDTSGGGDNAPVWQEMVTTRPITDTADAKRYIKEIEYEGRFQVINITFQGSTVVENKKSVRIA